MTCCRGVHRERVFYQVLPRDDCVVVVLPLSNDVRVTVNGRAVLQHHPDNQMIIEYPQRLDRLTMEGNRAKVLKRIGAVSNVKSMKATEQEDIVAVSARFFTTTRGKRLATCLGRWTKL